MRDWSSKRQGVSNCSIDLLVSMEACTAARSFSVLMFTMLDLLMAVHYLHSSY